MSSINKETMFSNWHTMRWVALSVGIFLAVMAVWYQDAVTGLFSGFFIFQAVTNTGCMVSQSCGVPQTNQPENRSDQDKEIKFTEVK
ncbi:hypothetical protein [Gracilimonas amylolytica]|uniref:hypothetical protein n=1 Tax=Gracilimonas amylolytica TaxID=1749045 RepID=UPI000CD83C02|nr:hypothetical protein [Gracilimonas amylolytica]